MSDDELRIALAKATGWTHIHRGGRGVLYGTQPGIPTFATLGVPDWTGDADDMRELEDFLESEELQSAYLSELVAIIGVYNTNCLEGKLALLQSTLRQRSEAALAALTLARKE